MGDVGDAPAAARGLLRSAGGAQPGKPLLVLVGGPPGSGKSVVADALAERARIVALHKDAFKEPLMTHVGVRSAQDSALLSGAAVRMLFVAADALLGRGLDVIVETTLNAADEERIAALLEARQCALVQVHVTAAIEVLVNRWRARVGRRHPGHLDAERLPEMRTRVVAGTWDPLALDATLLRVDTSAGEPFDAERWLEDLRRAQPEATTR